MSGGGKGGDFDVPRVKEPDPVAPPSPASRGSRESAQAADEARQREKKKFGQSKTVLSRGQGLGGAADAGAGNKTLG